MAKQNYNSQVLRHILNFITFNSIIYMNTSQIYAALSEISIYLDESILEEIKKFIETFIGDSWQNNPKLCIYISTAVVGQCKKIPAVQAHVQVPLGINVQKLMKYCVDTSKQQFINSIIAVVQKWPTCPSPFMHKLQILKLSFRIFKKFRVACKLLGEKLSIQASNNYLISSLFWVIYLIAKHLQSESDSVQIMTAVVPHLILQIYSGYLQAGSPEVVQDVVSKYFTIPESYAASLHEIHDRYNRQFHKILSESYTRRYLAELPNFSLLAIKPTILERLVDDLSNVFAKQFEGSHEFAVDQLSFLELRKDMTPQGFHPKLDKNGIIISQKISFDGEKAQIPQISTPRNVSFRKIQQVEQTPVTMRMQNLSWIRKNIQNLDQQKFANVQQCYANYNSSNFKLFQQKFSKILENVITQFSPSYKDRNRRKSQIYKFFVYCINVAIQMYNAEQLKKIFSSDLAILSIFCLCTQIFNFVYQAYNQSYTKYCQLFQVDQINAFWPINWFGYFIKLPKAVDDHLYELERKFLLKQIWKTDLGYKIVTNHEEVVKINQLRMLQRLQQHTKCRVDQICRQTVGQKMVKKIYNMIINLIEKRPIILKRNNIDQIIICSITASLSINEDSNKLSLQKIFSFYQKVSLSNQEDKQGLCDSQGNQMNIVDFYNNVFLQYIDDITKKYPQSSSYLSTPKRLQFAEKYKEGIQMTPFRSKFKQGESAFLKKRVENQNKPNYHLNLAINVKKQIQNQVMIDQDEESDQQNQFMKSQSK